MHGYVCTPHLSRLLAAAAAAAWSRPLLLMLQKVQKLCYGGDDTASAIYADIYHCICWTAERQ